MLNHPEEIGLGTAKFSHHLEPSKEDSDLHLLSPLATGTIKNHFNLFLKIKQKNIQSTETVKF